MNAAAHQFRHEALLYSGVGGFLSGCVPFIEEGLNAHEPVLVVESRERVELLRSALGRSAKQVQFADMGDVGANPARIIPAWREFVDMQGSDGRRLRGIGEPIWRERTPAELVECQRHESLLNVAFGKGQAWWLLCPYDVDGLEPAVIDEARRSHEYVTETGGARVRSQSFRGHAASGAPFDAPLSEPERADTLRFNRENLLTVRRRVAQHAMSTGMSAERTTNLVSAVNEVATNSVVHGGGGGTLRVWSEPGAVLCEVRDGGVYELPLADRERPGASNRDPRGLWLANQLCDLVQIRRVSAGTAVRMHMRLAS